MDWASSTLLTHAPLPLSFWSIFIICRVKCLNRFDLPKTLIRKQSLGWEGTNQHLSLPILLSQKINLLKVWHLRLTSWLTSHIVSSQLPLKPVSILDQLWTLIDHSSSSQRSSTWCKQASSARRPMKMLVLISNTSWRSVAHSLSRISQRCYITSPFPILTVGESKSVVLRQQGEEYHVGTMFHQFQGEVLSHKQDQHSAWEDIEFSATTWWDSPRSLGALSRLHTQVSSSWDVLTVLKYQI